MDIEELVKKHSGAMWIHEARIRNALTEQAAGYEAVAQVTKMNSDRLLRKANERIRQLETEQVPEGWKLVFAPFNCHGTRVCPFCGCNTNANAMACCARAATESIAAAPQQKKEGK